MGDVTSRCPEPGAWASYAAGRLDAATQTALDAHLAECATCRALAAEALRHEREAPTRDGSPGAAPPSPASTSPSATPERIGRYLILEPLGAGGMGEVLLAYDPALDRRVAVKLSRQRPGDDTQSLDARLEKEAQALARASDPNVVGVYDTGRFEGRPYVAMEYVPGTTLKAWLKEPRPRRQVLDVFIEAGRGLAAAHRVGVVHRDFKPDNVLLDQGGHARVTDFGIAMLRDAPLAEALGEFDSSDDDTQTVKTRTGALLGTPGYMSPEQWDARPTDARSDQFSFCVTLHEALVGKRPFARPAVRHTRPTFERTPESLDGVRRLPSRLRAVITRGLAVDPAGRFESMDALVSALERIRRPSRAPWAVAAALLVLAAGGAFAWASRSPCHGALERIAAPRQALGLSDGELALRVAALGAALEQRWATTWTRACVETNERREQPTEVLALRNDCLAAQARRYRQVLDRFNHPDGAAAAAALEALELSPAPEACLAVEPLLAVDAAPPEKRDAVAPLREAVATARTAIDVGDYDDAHRRLDAVADAVRATAFSRLDAEYAYARGLLALRERDNRGARQPYRDAMSRAVAARDFELAATAGTELLHVTGALLGAVEEAQLVDDLTGALVARLGSRALEGKLENVRGNLALERSRLDDAAAHFSRALALREAEFGHEHIETANVIGNQGLLETRRGDPVAAEALYREELRLRTALLGAHHPQLARPLEALASSLFDQGRADEALELARRAFELREAVLGPKHRLTVRSREVLASYHLDMGHDDEARRLLLEVLAAWPPDSLEAASTQSALADLELHAGRPADALRWCLDAQQSFARHVRPDDEEALWEREREADIHLALGNPSRADTILLPLEATWRQRPDSEGRLADVLALRARAQLAQGHLLAAAPLIAEARRLSEPLGDSPARNALMDQVQATVWWAQGRRSDATALAAAARASLERLFAPREKSSLDAWLATHRIGQTSR